MVPEIGSVWNLNLTDRNVIVIQMPGRLVLFMYSDGRYGSAYMDDFISGATPIKSREEVLS